MYEINAGPTKLSISQFTVQAANKRLGALLLATIWLAALPVSAGELLLNRSFETPTAPAEGNNFYAAIPDWAVLDVVPANSESFNIIRPGPGYTNNPQATPAGGGSQYLDVNAASGTLRQPLYVNSAGMITLSGWFSVRDTAQTLTGMVIRLRDSANNVVASASVAFDASEPIGLWKQAFASSVPVAAGSYIFEAEIPNNANFDLASAIYDPPLAISKSSYGLQDPVSGSTNPKFIPGGVAAYVISVSSPPGYAVDGNTLAITDTTPANLALIVADVGETGSGPVDFAGGGSTLTFGYDGLGSVADNVDFSDNHGVSWEYAPVPGIDGSDPAVTHVRVYPQGKMSPGSSFSIVLRYIIK